MSVCATVILHYIYVTLHYITSRYVTLQLTSLGARVSSVEPSSMSPVVGNKHHCHGGSSRRDRWRHRRTTVRSERRPVHIVAVHHADIVGRTESRGRRCGVDIDQCEGQCNAITCDYKFDR